MIYSVESWILAMLGWCWIIVRTMYNARSTMEEYLMYSQVIVSTMNLLCMSLSADKRDPAKAFMGIILVNWLFGIYSYADSMEWDSPTFLSSNTATNSTTPISIYTNTTCCPNKNTPLWNQAIFYNGFGFYWATMAITMGFQTIQLFVAAGALLHTQPTLFPGVSMGYCILSFSAFLLFTKHIGLVGHPCPNGIIQLFSGFIELHLSFTLILFTSLFPILGATDGVFANMKARLIWKFFCVCITTLYVVTVGLHLYNTKILTWPFLGFSGVALLPIFYSIWEMIIPAPHVVTPAATTTTSQSIHIPPTHNHNKPVTTRKTKWVMPIQTQPDFIKKTNKTE
jgi:hypothetical protein